MSHMKIITPNYYTSFKCIAKRCKHNCCIGWEIDVDSQTYNKYKKVPGDFGKKLMQNIFSSGDCAYIKLSCNDRCPFLNEHNLCEIINVLGEDMLSNICKDHPRFKNYYDNHVEIGLGMACEEAARIILSRDCLFILSGDANDVSKICSEKEKEFFVARSKLFDALSQRDKKLDNRLDNICKLFSINKESVYQFEFVPLLMELECLDPDWKLLVSKLENWSSKNTGYFENEPWDLFFENFITYIIYRHLSKGMHTGIKAYISFALLSHHIIKCIFVYHLKKFGKLNFEDAVEYCRMFSSEIEYSDENLREIIMELEFL